MTDSEPASQITIVHHHYLPVKGWLFQKGNYVMVQFLTEVPESEIQAAFASPTTGTTIDTALVDHLKSMPKGAAIKLPKDDTISDRSLKVRVNKAAKIAGRKLGWAEVSDGHIARVIELLPVATSTNGQVVTTEAPAQDGATEEASTSTRNRR